jgi:hypothetical protein
MIRKVYERRQEAKAMRKEVFMEKKCRTSMKRGPLPISSEIELTI